MIGHETPSIQLGIRRAHRFVEDGEKPVPIGIILEDYLSPGATRYNVVDI